MIRWLRRQRREYGFEFVLILAVASAVVIGNCALLVWSLLRSPTATAVVFVVLWCAYGLHRLTLDRPSPGEPP